MADHMASQDSLSGWKNEMPYCNDCYSYIDGPKWDGKKYAFVCPACGTTIADNPSTLSEWAETQTQEI
jgi:predicted RNA-binding Zn-ribbon protein involved in translation (DUF1610 family)